MRLISHVGVCLLTALLTLAPAGSARAQDPEAACSCVGTWQTTILAARNLAACKEGRGDKCLGFEVRITKPWAWDAGRQECVGSFEYWEGTRGGKPEWQSAGTFTTQTVTLDRARQRCKEIGQVSSDDPQPSRDTRTVEKAADKLRDTVRQAMRDRPSVNQAKKALRGDDYLLTPTGSGFTITTPAEASRLPSTRTCPMVRPILKDAALVDGALTSTGIASVEHASIKGTINGGGDFVSNDSASATDRYARNTPESFDVNLLNATVVVSIDGAGTQRARWERPDAVTPSGNAVLVQRASGALAGAVDFCSGGGDASAKSVEHASIKGTINGGGEFIRHPAPDAPFQGRLLRVGLGALATERVAMASRILAPPGAEYKLANATVAVDIGANGISAIAVLKGRARATELVTGQAREVQAGQMVVVVPGIGVAAPVPMTSDVRAFMNSMIGSSGGDGSDAGRDTRRVQPGTDLAPLTGSRVLRGGEQWALRTTDGTLALSARIPWKQVAGAAGAMEIRVNGQLLTSRLGNKTGSFSLADGREFDYLHPQTNHWMVFYSPDFVSNNTGAGGDYQVVTDPGAAYRYTWDLSPFTGNGKVAEVVIRNPITSSDVPLEVSFDEPGQPGGGTRTLERPRTSGEIEAPWRGRPPAADSETQARPQAGGELTGTWTMDYWVFGFPKPRQLTLEQRGNAVTGTMQSPGGNPVRIEGAIAGATLTLDFIYDNLATLSELTSPEVARKIAGIKSKAQLQKTGADTWKGTLAGFYLSTTGTEVNAKADGGTPLAAEKSAPGPTTMRRVP